MKIIKEQTLKDFQSWAGADDCKNRIIEENKAEEFEQYIEELYPNGLTDTELNDLLWFDEEDIFDFLGIEIS